MPDASLLRGTHPARAARRARAPAASTPHAPAHSPRRTGARLAQPWTCLWPPRAALHMGARAPPLSGGLAHGPANERRRTTVKYEKMLRAHTGTKHKAGDADRWGTETLGVRPGNGVAALFLPCERGSHRHTAVVTSPRLRLALWLLLENEFIFARRREKKLGTFIAKKKTRCFAQQNPGFGCRCLRSLRGD